MTVLEALTILEAAVLECKKRHVNTPEVRKALNLLEQYVRPAWLMLQFRYHALKERPAKYVERKVQQQVLLATFPGIRDSVKELIGKRMVTLALEFHDTHNMKMKEEIERLAKEYGKLKEPWVLQAAVMKSHASIRRGRPYTFSPRARDVLIVSSRHMKDDQQEREQFLKLLSQPTDEEVERVKRRIYDIHRRKVIRLVWSAPKPLQ